MSPEGPPMPPEKPPVPEEQEEVVLSPEQEGEVMDAGQISESLMDSKNQEGLAEKGLVDVAQAQELIEAAKVFSGPRLTAKEKRAWMKESFMSLHAYALKGGNSEVIELVEKELESVEPKSKMDKLIEDKLTKEVFGAAKASDASATLHIMLYGDPRFKRMSASQRAYLETLKEEYKAKS